MSKQQEQLIETSVEADAKAANKPKPEYDPACDFTSDAPITSHTEDKFNRTDFAHRIAETLMHRRAEDSVVVGIYGKWGSGKSSILNMMQEKINSYGYNTIVINFNPWYFSSEEDIIRGFFAELYTKLGEIIPDIKKHISKIAGILAPFSISLKAPFIGGPQLRIDGKKLENTIKNFTNTSLEDEKKEVEKILYESKKHIIIFIDDIDRLDKEETHVLFKLVKLFANFPFTAYILAFDATVVAEAIGERYGQDKEAGRAFLEKIVQIPLHLPALDRVKIQNILFQKISNIFEIHSIDVIEEDILALKNNFFTPFIEGFLSFRTINTYCNNLNFIFPLLKNEVNITDLIIIEGIKIINPDFYNKAYKSILPIINENKIFVTQESHKIFLEGVNEKLFGNTSGENHEKLKPLFRYLFPILFSHSLSTNDPEYMAKKRICSQSYFHKYFQYTVPEGDISDELLKVYLEDFLSEDSVVQENAMREVCANEHYEHFLLYVSSRINDFSLEILERLNTIFLANSTIIPHNSDFFWKNTLYDTARFFYLYIERLAHSPESFLEASVTDTVKEFLSYIPELSFADICVKAITHNDVSWINKEEKSEINEYFTALIKKENESEPLYKRYKKNSVPMYSLWKELDSTNELSDSLKQIFDNNPHEIIEFIECFCTRKLLNSKVKLEIDLSAYGTIQRILDDAYIFDILKKIFKVDFEDIKDTSCPEDIPQDMCLARQFAYFHKNPLYKRKS